MFDTTSRSMFAGVVPVEGGVTVSTPNKPPTFVAERLARVFGTEEDPVNCSWFFKVGACRNGDACYKKHNAPTSSETLLLSGLYNCTPEGNAIANEQPWTDEMYDIAQSHLEQFYEDVFMTLAEYGELEEVVVLDNTTRNLIGNVYAKFYHEEDAHRALRGLTGRFYDGRVICAEFTPVADFREARCRAHHEKRCPRPGVCGFMHIKHIPRAIKRRIVRLMYQHHPEFLDRTGRPMNKEDYLKARKEEEERRYLEMIMQREDIDGVPWSPESDEDIPDDMIEFYEAALRRERDGSEEFMEEQCEEDGLDGETGETLEGTVGTTRRRKRPDAFEQDGGEDEHDDVEERPYSPFGDAQEGTAQRRRRRRRREDTEGQRSFREEPNEGDRNFREEPNEGHRTFRDAPNDGRRTFREDRKDPIEGDGRRRFREDPNSGRRTFREDPTLLQKDEINHDVAHEEGSRRRRRRHSTLEDPETNGVERARRGASPPVNDDDV